MKSNPSIQYYSCDNFIQFILFLLQNTKLIMSKLDQEFDEEKIMFQSGTPSPRILRKKSPNKISGWDDQQSDFISQIINNKLKNTAGTFRIKPSRPIYERLTARKQFFPSQQKSLSIQPAVISKLKQELKYLDSPKKKPLKNKFPKVNIFQQKSALQQSQINSKINSLISGPQSPLKATRLLKSTLLESHTIKSQKDTPSKRKFLQQHSEDRNLTVFKQKLLNMVDKHTTPIQMTIRKNRVNSQLRNRSTLQPQMTSSSKLPNQSSEAYIKIQEFKMPSVPLYKIVISQRQTQQKGKQLESKIFMSRMT